MFKEDMQTKQVSAEGKFYYFLPDNDRQTCGALLASTCEAKLKKSCSKL